MFSFSLVILEPREKKKVHCRAKASYIILRKTNAIKTYKHEGMIKSVRSVLLGSPHLQSD